MFPGRKSVKHETEGKIGPKTAADQIKRGILQACEGSAIESQAPAPQ